MIMRVLSAVLCILAAILAPAEAAPGDRQALVIAINKAKSGGVVVVPAGEYNIADLPIRRSITLKGEGDVVFTSTRSVRKGLLVPAQDVSLRVENITFRGAQSPDLNGAGIRHDGLDLEVVNCTFEDNENGILATGSDFGHIRILRSTFRNNGHGDGYSHGIYVSSADSIDIQDSKFIGTRIGHHVKSLAASTRVAGSTLDDADGRTSYALDVSAGGAVTFENNTVVKNADADNESFINYDLTRGGKAKSLRIVGNRFISRHPGARLLRNDTKLKPVFQGNTFVTEGRGRVLDAPKDDSPQPSPAVPAPDLRGAAAPAFAPEPAFPAPTVKSGVLAAPKLKTPAGALAALRFENPFARPSAAGVVTFGQAFAAGVVKPGDAMALDIGGARTFVQVDVKARHADGSIRHAALSAMAPSVKAHGAVDAALFRAAATPPALDVAAAVEGLTLPVSTRFTDAVGPRTLTIDAGALAAKALVANKDRWLDGPLVRETRFETPVAPHLLLRVDARIASGGALRLSVALSNEKTFSAGLRDLRYDVAVGAGPAPVFAARDVAQHRASVWRKVFVRGAAPRLHIVRDLDPFIAANVLPPLDPSQGASAAAIAELYIQSDSDAPLAPAAIQKYFPTTGGRGDIGLAPQWTALALLAQTPASFQTMIANAEAAGAVPWHMRDEATGEFVSLLKRPRFWGEPRGLEEQYAPDRPHPDLFAGSDGGWTPDIAHAPALAAVPYALTADRHYADELAAEAAFMLNNRWPAERRGGLVATDVDQVRESAWALRTLSDAEFLLPDDYPLKDYFRRATRENIAAMKVKYVDKRAMRGAGELEGWFGEKIDRAPERISPWQNDYLVLSLAAAARRGSEDARALLNWTSNFQAGRFLSPDFDPKLGFAYLFNAKDGATQRPVPTWRAVFERTFASGRSSFEGADGYPGMAAGYVGSAYAALGALVSETARPDAMRALAETARLSAASGMWSPQSESGVVAAPQFLFTVTLRDGGRLTRADFGPRPHSSRASFAYGGDGADSLAAGNFGDALFGGGGDDRLSGGGGDDDLFGEEGDDRLDGGAGDDRMTGGAGRDEFHVGVGRDRILDFDPDTDRLISPDFATEGGAGSASIVNGAGGAEIRFSSGAVVILEHIAADRLRPGNLFFGR